MLCERLGDFAPDKFVRHQVHLQVQRTQFHGGRRADGGDFCAANVAQIVEAAEE